MEGKRGTKLLIEGEGDALIALVSKTLPWMFLTVILCVALMMTGFYFVVKNVDLGRFAVLSGRVRDMLLLYSLISAGIVFLLIIFCIVATYTIAHNIVAPVVRIARELRAGAQEVHVRAGDVFLLPLINEINKVLKRG